MGQVVLWLIGLLIVSAMVVGIIATFRHRKPMEHDHTKSSGPKLGDLVDEQDKLAQPVQPSKPVTTKEAQSDLFLASAAAVDIPTVLTESEQTVVEEPAQPTEVPALIVLHVMAPEGSPFTGPKIIEVMRQNHLIYGKKSIFHRIREDGKIRFSVASAFEPGVFDLEHIKSFKTAGLGFFMDTKQVLSVERAFEEMLQTVESVAQRLGGEILDEHHQPVNRAALHARLSRVEWALKQEHEEATA